MNSATDDDNRNDSNRPQYDRAFYQFRLMTAPALCQSDALVVNTVSAAVDRSAGRSPSSVPTMPATVQFATNEMLLKNALSLIGAVLVG